MRASPIGQNPYFMYGGELNFFTLAHSSSFGFNALQRAFTAVSKENVSISTGIDVDTTYFERLQAERTAWSYYELPRQRHHSEQRCVS